MNTRFIKPSPCAGIILVLATGLVSFQAAHRANAQGVRAFGTPDGILPLRGFGDPTSEESLRFRFPELVVNINGYDRLLAGTQMKKYDENGDGIATKREWMENKGKPERFEECDFDGDSQVTRFEHTLWWVQYRIGKTKAKRATAKASAKKRASLRAGGDEDGGAGVAPELLEQAESLADHLLNVYDRDDSGAIERVEFKNERTPYGNVSAADANRDGQVVESELAHWLLARMPKDNVPRLEPALQQLDADKDGQISLFEFAPDPSETLLAKFTSIDRNGDGLITAGESTARSISQPSATTFTSDKMSVFVGYGVAISEIDVVEDVWIDDLDIRIQLSKGDDNFVQLVLIPPDNRAIVLFKGGWYPWRPPIFDDTFFDDEAPAITKMLRTPPVRRALQPPGVSDEEQRSLVDVKGLNVRGRWRLVVRNQNDDEGLLRRWSLVVRPTDKPVRQGGDADEDR